MKNLAQHGYIDWHGEHRNVMRAYGVPEEQLITVPGGEDHQFQGFSIKVIPSIRCPLDHKHHSSSATSPPRMKAPLTLEQIHPGGGTLAYPIPFHGYQIFAFGGNNYIEREIAGLEPDSRIDGRWCFQKGDLRLYGTPLS